MLENHLETVSVGIYSWAALKTQDGHDLYYAPNNPWYAWTYKQVCTQDNVAGGALRIDITPVAGQVMRLVCGQMAASGSRAVTANVRDSAGVVVVYVDAVGAGAGAASTWPKAATASGTSGGAINPQDLLVPSTNYFSAQVTAAAQTETALFDAVFLLSSATTPTISWANSGGTPNATAAAINTQVLVAMP